MGRGRIRLEIGGVALHETQQNEQKEAGRKKKIIGEKKRGEEKIVKDVKMTKPEGKKIYLKDKICKENKLNNREK